MFDNKIIIYANSEPTKDANFGGVRIPLTLNWPRPPEDTLNGNHKQLRGGKENAAHQQTTNFIYCLFGVKIFCILIFMSQVVCN